MHRIPAPIDVDLDRRAHSISPGAGVGMLPVTGGLVIGHYVGLDDIIAAAIALVLLGIAAFRYASRIGRGRSTILIGAAALAAANAVAAHVAGVSWGLAVATAALLSVLLLAGVARLAQRAGGGGGAVA